LTFQHGYFFFTGNFEPITPKCIYACKTFLVLEDLSAAGFRMGERRKGLDLDHCLLVMRTVARFHAASVVLHEQDPDSMKEYSNSFFTEPGVDKTWSPYLSGREGWGISNENYCLPGCDAIIVL
jgi:hypothetical protein